MPTSIYQIMDSLTFYKRNYLLITLSLTGTLIHEYHATPLGGHFWNKGTLHKPKKIKWKGMKKQTRRYIRECDIRQRMKLENVPSLGLLQP